MTRLCLNVNYASRVIDGQKWRKLPGTLFVGCDAKDYTIDAMEKLEQNPLKRRSKGESVSSTIIIGMNVAGRPVWNIEDIIKEFAKARTKQIKSMVRRGTLHGKKQAAAASFLLQRGLWYDPRVQGKKLVLKDAVEDSVQIIVISDIGEKPQQFWANMRRLGDKMSVVFDQEEVIVQNQQKGMIVETAIMGPVA